MPRDSLSIKAQLSMALSGNPPGQGGPPLSLSLFRSILSLGRTEKCGENMFAVSYSCGICFSVEQQHLDQPVPVRNLKTEASSMSMETQQASLTPFFSSI